MYAPTEFDCRPIPHDRESTVVDHEHSPEPKAAFDSFAALPKDEEHDGGRAAWLTLAGGWLMLVATFGYASAFGVYQDFYTSAAAHTASASRVSWIGSVQIFFMVAVGCPVGYAFDRGHFRKITVAGSALYIFSVFMLSLADPTKYYQVFLAQGPGMGIGAGMVYMPALTVQAHHWRRHSAAAMGAVMTGNCAGAIGFSILLNRQLPHGFAPAVRASAYIVVGCLVVANAIMSPGPARVPAGIRHRVTVRSVLDVPFVVALIGVALGLAAVYFPLFYLQVAAIQHGVSPNFAFYIIAIMNALSIPGRIGGGFLADRFGVLNVITPSSIVCGGLTFVMLAVRSEATAIILAVFFGLASGVFFALVGPVPTMFLKRPEELGLRMSITFGITSVGLLIGPPVDGALADGAHYLKPAIFSGCLFFGCSILLLISRAMLARSKAAAGEKEKVPYAV